jgi:hypothetical protein
MVEQGEKGEGGRRRQGEVIRDCEGALVEDAQNPRNSTEIDV